MKVPVHLFRPGAGIHTIDMDAGPRPRDDSIALLVSIVRLMRPSLLVEIGTFDGETTVCLAHTMPENATLYGLDLYPEWAVPLVVAWGLMNRVRLVRGYSHLDHTVNPGHAWGDTHTYGTIMTLPDGIEFAFVDGDHTYTGVKGDTEQLWPKMAPGGIIAFDDVNGDGVRDYVPRYFADALYFRQGQGLALVQKPPKVISRLEDGSEIPWGGTA